MAIFFIILLINMSTILVLTVSSRRHKLFRVIVVAELIVFILLINLL